MREIDVVRQVRTFLMQAGLADHRVVDLYTDAHPTLREDSSLQPFQRFTLLLDGLTVHPDLVGRLSDGETTFAIEAKGGDGLLRGLAQAASYRVGFHCVFLASAGAPPADLIALARQQHVGILAAFPDQVRVLELPPPHMPRYALANAVRQQFLTTSALQTTFSFNVPTHYLSIAVALRGISTTTLPALEARFRAAYPVLPRGTASFLSVLRGAQKLGIARARGDQVEPTMVGAAAGQLLPDLGALAAIHRVISRPPRSATLVSESPQSGAVLRWLLAGDPVVTLIVATLMDVGGGPLTMPELARRALERDKVQALTIFFKAELISEITDARSNVVWSQVRPHHFRSNTFYQYKSILKHAGILVPHRLGGASVVDYRPNADVWELVDSSLVQGEARADGAENN